MFTSSHNPHTSPMRPLPLLVVVSCVVIATAATAQQALVCPAPGSVSSRPCELYHYHVQLYRPETKGFAEVTGVNQFSSESACEQVRNAQMRRNAGVVDHFKRVRQEQQYEPDRFGSCHCDLTIDKASPAFLTDVQRLTQIRTAEDVRLRIRERLLDAGLTSDNELVRTLISPPPSLPLLGGPKLVPLPNAGAAVASVTSPDDLKSTRVTDISKPVMISLDLPLADPATGEQVAVPEPVQASSTAQPEPPSAEVIVPAEEAAESFISYETQRIQNVLKASSAITDASVKSRIFEACQERIQLLSNLRTLIEGSGVRSRLATAARGAQSEPDRVALVSRLFGTAIAKPWAPKDASDVILEPLPDVESDPERVLRDGAGRFNDQQKRRALYALLARYQPTSDQQLWLITVIDSFLR